MSRENSSCAMSKFTKNGVLMVYSNDKNSEEGGAEEALIAVTEVSDADTLKLSEAASVAIDSSTSANIDSDDDCIKLSDLPDDFFDELLTMDFNTPAVKPKLRKLILLENGKLDYATDFNESPTAHKPHISTEEILPPTTTKERTEDPCTNTETSMDTLSGNKNTVQQKEKLNMVFEKKCPSTNRPPSSKMNLLESTIVHKDLEQQRPIIPEATKEMLCKPNEKRKIKESEDAGNSSKSMEKESSSSERKKFPPPRSEQIKQQDSSSLGKRRADLPAGGSAPKKQANTTCTSSKAPLLKNPTSSITTVTKKEAAKVCNDTSMKTKNLKKVDSVLKKSTEILPLVPLAQLPLKEPQLRGKLPIPARYRNGLLPPPNYINMRNFPLRQPAPYLQMFPYMARYQSRPYSNWPHCPQPFWPNAEFGRQRLPPQGHPPGIVRHRPPAPTQVLPKKPTLIEKTDSKGKSIDDKSTVSSTNVSSTPAIRVMQSCGKDLAPIKAVPTTLTPKRVKGPSFPIKENPKRLVGLAEQVTYNKVTVDLKMVPLKNFCEASTSTEPPPTRENQDASTQVMVEIAHKEVEAHTLSSSEGVQCNLETPTCDSSTQVMVETAHKEVEAQPLCSSESVQCNLECQDCFAKWQIIACVRKLAASMLAKNLSSEAMTLFLEITGSASKMQNSNPDGVQLPNIDDFVQQLSQNEISKTADTCRKVHLAVNTCGLKTLEEQVGPLASNSSTSNSSPLLETQESTLANHLTNPLLPEINGADKRKLPKPTAKSNSEQIVNSEEQLKENLAQGGTNNSLDQTGGILSLLTDTTQNEMASVNNEDGSKSRKNDKTKAVCQKNVPLDCSLNADLNQIIEMEVAKFVSKKKSKIPLEHPDDKFVPVQRSKSDIPRSITQKPRNVNVPPLNQRHGSEKDVEKYKLQRPQDRRQSETSVVTLARPISRTVESCQPVASGRISQSSRQSPRPIPRTYDDNEYGRFDYHHRSQQFYRPHWESEQNFQSAGWFNYHHKINQMYYKSEWDEYHPFMPTPLMYLRGLQQPKFWSQREECGRAGPNWPYGHPGPPKI